MFCLSHALTAVGKEGPLASPEDPSTNATNKGTSVAMGPSLTRSPPKIEDSCGDQPKWICFSVPYAVTSKINSSTMSQICVKTPEMNPFVRMVHGSSGVLYWGCSCHWNVSLTPLGRWHQWELFAKLWRLCW